MKLTIEGDEAEIKNVFQAIGSSQEHEIKDLKDQVDTIFDVINRKVINGH